MSARHLSFLETGRAQPSREMVLRLAGALRLRANDAEALMLAAGFAPRSGPQARASVRVRGLAPCGRDVIDQVVALQAADTEDTAIEVAAGVLAPLGLTHFLTGSITPGGAGRGPTVQVGNTSRALIYWLAHCRAQNYTRDCPFTRAALRARRPFFWDEVLRSRSLAPREAQIVEDARDHRIGSGFVMPLASPDGRVRALSAMGQYVDADNPRTAVEARLIATALLEHLDQLGAEERERAGDLKLGPRESECLRWAASGRDISWIADRCGLPDREVEAALERACSALGALDLNEAMIRARRYRLLEFG